jgi:hypothetical protein
MYTWIPVVLPSIFTLVMLPIFKSWIVESVKADHAKKLEEFKSGLNRQFEQFKNAEARELESFRSELAYKQVVAPMRQAWINSFRDNLAELISIASQSDEEHEIMVCLTSEDRTKLLLLEQRIKLMLNPEEAENGDLESAITDLMKATYLMADDVRQQSERVIALARPIIRREWKKTSGWAYEATITGHTSQNSDSGPSILK